ncbi:uncharacterized protein BJ171DRAFT_489752 [Polychytrium aggregatum]|uniref:uncharacterized protein n=1 Tax=Polychytrium aggregatum TaxID=110093 RepID=UPI0022FE15EA|nr:uncharacterized protein BJ171DRAFT_489752 [Polychytrium aggregatum]KAI9208719.1 hypothetical protein BJ171DRAFT_489752 [Polychytrium aggregatum]
MHMLHPAEPLRIGRIHELLQKAKTTAVSTAQSTARLWGWLGQQATESTKAAPASASFWASVAGEGSNNNSNNNSNSSSTGQPQDSEAVWTYLESHDLRGLFRQRGSTASSEADGGSPLANVAGHEWIPLSRTTHRSTFEGSSVSNALASSAASDIDQESRTSSEDGDGNDDDDFRDSTRLLGERRGSSQPQLGVIMSFLYLYISRTDDLHGSSGVACF